jgi:hypothetical protein
MVPRSRFAHGPPVPQRGSGDKRNNCGSFVLSSGSRGLKWKQHKISLNLTSSKTGKLSPWRWLLGIKYVSFSLQHVRNILFCARKYLESYVRDMCRNVCRSSSIKRPLLISDFNPNSKVSTHLAEPMSNFTIIRQTFFECYTRTNRQTLWR